MKPIVIMGTDEHARAVYGALVGMKRAVMCFNSREPWVIEGSIDDWCLKASNHGAWLAADTIAALYWRSYDGVTGYNDLDQTNRQSLFETWLKHLEESGVLCINGWQAWQDHRTKPFQMASVEHILDLHPHVAVPDIYYGAPPHAYPSEGGFVIKGPQGGAFTVASGREWPQDVERCWQRRVDGYTYRVYANSMGDHCVYQITSQYVDYRQDPDPHITRRLNCPPLALGACHDIITGLDWEWAGIDLIASDGMVYILDVNPSPMFLGFQRNDEVLAMLASQLVEGRDE